MRGLLFASVVVAILLSCSGKTAEPVCDKGTHYCDVDRPPGGLCCPAGYACGYGVDGCAVGSCCKL